MLSTPTQQGPTKAPVKMPPVGSVGQPGIARNDGCGVATGGGAGFSARRGACFSARRRSTPRCVGAAADAAGEPLDVDPPQAAKRMDTTTSIGSRARPLVHGVWIIVASSTMPTASAT